MSGGGLQAASICTSVLIIIHKVKEVFFQFSVSVAVKLQSVQFNVVTPLIVVYNTARFGIDPIPSKCRATIADTDTDTNTF